MQIWVDADACPTVIRDIICRAAQRKNITAYFVANRSISLPNHPLLRQIQVSQGFDLADQAIIDRCESGDLVITSDIPLAAAVIEKGAQALSPRGEKFSPDSIKQRLSMRDFLDTLRSSGIQTGGPAPMNQQDRKKFADHLDSALAKLSK